MLILDENVVSDHEVQLWRWGIRTKKIGDDVGRSGMKDEEIIPLLHSLPRPVLFTNDLRFYERDSPHPNYCIVVVSAGKVEMPPLIRRFLKHPNFDSEAKCLGRIVLLTQHNLRVRQFKVSGETTLEWPE